MKRRPNLVVTGLVLLAFGLGVVVGARFFQRPVIYQDVPVPQQFANPPAAPDASSPPACVDIRDAGSLVGKSGCVTGLVLRVYSARTGNTFLDFCQDYRACPFSSVIFASDKDKFSNLQSLQGKRVQILGNVVSYQGRAEIIIRDPKQVQSGP